MSYEMSQVTCGGVDVNCLDEGLALPDGTVVVGEALNMDGLCGGYNLAFAFASASPSSMGSSVKREESSFSFTN